VPERSPNGGEESQSLFERWQTEQQNWQRLITGYIDKAATDEAFLVNLGNAMRGSLMANKPYPGTGTSAETDAAASGSEIDEVVFAVRRLEAQINDLTTTIDRLIATGTADAGTPPDSAEGM